MKFLRRRTIYRFAVLVLLFQAGLDLSHPALCALDAEPLVLGSFANARVTSSVDPQSQPSQTSKPGYVDDCFCCSPCVDAEAIAQPIAVALVSTSEDELPVKDLPLLPTFLFHPPQLLSERS